jgi:hypothetical protein
MSLIQTDEESATCVMYMTDYISRLNRFFLYRTLYALFISSYSTSLSNPIDTYNQIKSLAATIYNGQWIMDLVDW